VALVLASPCIGREWNLGKNLFKLQGEAISYDGKRVKLKLDDSGMVIPVDVEKLSDADQQYLKTTYPNGLKEEKAKPEDKAPDKPSPDAPAPDESTPDQAAPAKRAAKGPAAKAGAVSVEVVSLTVTKPPKNEAEGAAFQTPGTHITLLVSAPGRMVTSLDAEKSKITECIDDKSTNLAKPMGENLTGDAPAGLTLNIAPDGSSGTIELNQPRIPKAAATRIRIRGELHLVCGDGEKTQTVKVPVNIVLGVGL
jgi:hypothetical protein